MPCSRFINLFLCLLLSFFFGSSVFAQDNKMAFKHISGYVLSGDTPITNAGVGLYLAGASESILLGKATTDKHGYYDISYELHAKSRNQSRHTEKHKSGRVLYLLANGEKTAGVPSSVRLAAVVDASRIPEKVYITPPTTVATAYAMAQYSDGNTIGGKNPGLKNAAGTAQNLADLSNGEAAELLKTEPNGRLTFTLQIFNSLANMLDACVQDANNCAALFSAAKPPQGSEPENTFAAMTIIARNPGAQVVERFIVSLLSTQYQPALRPGLKPDVPKVNDVTPNAWVLAVRYKADGKLSGPGNLAFDAKGNAWINNNFQFSDKQTPQPPLCGSTKVYKLTPTGENVPGSPFGSTDGSGIGSGGLYGAGFGIAVGPENSAWITNFGFKTPNCPENPELLAVSVSRFSPKGERLSLPDGEPVTNTPGGYGYDGAGHILQPQGIVSDLAGNIWVANCSSLPVPGTNRMVSNITRFPLGDPDRVENYLFPVDEFDKPFDVAIDHQRHVWITGNGTGSVLELDHNGVKVGDYITGDHIKRPMGIAADSEGNLWFADAGLPNPPCPAVLSEDDVIGSDGSSNTAAAVTLIRHLGEKREVTTFSKTIDMPRDGLRWPWGIAIDGNDNIWVANFAGKRIMQLCGVKEQNCRPGVHTGEPFSLDSGYASDALKRVTGIQIDTSGNVWAVNNYEEIGLYPPGQENPGGHEIVVFIGLAAPVKTPLLGPVQQP